MSDWTTLTEKTSRDNADKVLIGEPANTSKYLLISTLIAGLGGGGGGVAPYVLLRDVKSQGTNGGTFTAGARRVRDLNEETIDTDSVCSLSANQFTLDAGTYRVRISCPAYSVSSHQAYLYCVSDTADIAVGTTEFDYSSDGHSQTRSIVVGRFTMASSKTFEVQHECTVNRSNDGFGHMGNLDSEIYTIVELWKEE